MQLLYGARVGPLLQKAPAQLGIVLIAVYRAGMPFEHA